MVLIDDDERANSRTVHFRERVTESLDWQDRVRVGDYTVLSAFDCCHFLDLRLNVARAKSTVNNADPTLLRQNDCHLCPGDRVHIGGNDRTFDYDVFGEVRGKVYLVRIAARQDATLWAKQEIVECAAVNKLQQFHAFPMRSDV